MRKIVVAAALIIAGMTHAQAAQEPKATASPDTCDTLLRVYATFADRASTFGIGPDAPRVSAKFMAQEVRETYLAAGCSTERLANLWMFFQGKATWPWAEEPWLDSYQDQKRQDQTRWK